MIKRNLKSVQNSKSNIKERHIANKNTRFSWFAIVFQAQSNLMIFYQLWNCIIHQSLYLWFNINSLMRSLCCMQGIASRPYACSMIGYLVYSINHDKNYRTLLNFCKMVLLWPMIFLIVTLTYVASPYGRKILRIKLVKKYDSENVCLKKRKIMQLNMDVHRFNYPH